MAKKETRTGMDMRMSEMARKDVVLVVIMVFSRNCVFENAVVYLLVSCIASA